ncbi:unnamed protein product [Diamesa serratosioi]
MLKNLLLTLFILSVCLLQHTSGDDDENFYFANNNNKFFYNINKNCPPNYYFDVDYFKCRLCDQNFNLMASKNKQKCLCERNFTEVFEYDNILKRPVCEKQMEMSTPFVPSNCSMRYVNASKFSSLRKSVKIYRDPGNLNCLCDDKLNENYHNEYCIRKELLKDLKSYQYFKYLPLSQTRSLNTELKFIIFFCKILHQRHYCNYLANLCVLTFYNLEKYSPCYLFYTQQQPQQQTITMDDNGQHEDGSEFDGGEKLKPFLFFKSNRFNKVLFEKFIDFPYSLSSDNINSTINFTIVSYNVTGELTEMRQMKMNDLNLCNRVSSPSGMWQQRLQFAENINVKCNINLKELMLLEPEMNFKTIFLNYFENKVNFLQTIPVLIRNSFDHNENDDIEKWQLVKRFFIIDTVSGSLASSLKDTLNDDVNFSEKYSQINYVKSVELNFQLKSDDDTDDNSDEMNKINIPLLVLSYGQLNITQRVKEFKNAIDESDMYNVEFTFRVKFGKKPKFNFLFQILLPVIIMLAFLYSLMQTFFYKVRQQKIDYDLSILFNFFINLLSNISNAFFAFILVFVNYVFFVYKTQTIKVRIILPLTHEQNVIELLLYFAIVFKMVKLLKLFYDMINIDIFFIDWERPKYNYNENFMQYSNNKSHPGTPSITSSLKHPTLSSSPPCYDSVSAWRLYFIANEFQELITKRKISVLLHIVFVTAVLMVCVFYFIFLFQQNCATTDVLNNNNNNNILLKMAVGVMVYCSLYLVQRIYNYLVYERFVDNCIQNFVDVSSIANISVLILINSYGYYIHGRSVHGRSDIDMLSMVLNFKREEEALTGHRGLLAGSEQQTYTILAPRNLRIFYEKLITPMHSKTSHYHQQFNNHSIKMEQNFENTILTYNNINRFFGAFIDHALKDVDYVIKEKNLFEVMFDCELEASISDSKGVFYFDNGHSFDKVLFYGNETTLFGFEFLLFIFILYLSGNYLVAILSIGIVFKIFSIVITHLAKNNLARKTMIDKRFLI